MKLKELFNKAKKLYGKLPSEFKVAIEYLIPSYLVTVAIEELSKVESNKLVVLILTNILLIFLRQIKPRFERLRK